MLIDLREEGRWREKERNINARNMYRLPHVGATTRDQTHNLGVCPYWESNQQPFGLQDDPPTN